VDNRSPEQIHLSKLAVKRSERGKGYWEKKGGRKMREGVAETALSMGYVHHFRSHTYGSILGRQKWERRGKRVKKKVSGKRRFVFSTRRRVKEHASFDLTNEIEGWKGGFQNCEKKTARFQHVSLGETLFLGRAPALDGGCPEKRKKGNGGFTWGKKVDALNRGKRLSDESSTGD